MILLLRQRQRRRTLLLCSSLLLLFVSMAIYGCSFLPPKLTLPTSVTNATELEPYLLEAVSKQQPPSISIGVLKGNDIVYRKAIGYADPLSNIRATPDTVYQWWSLTKLFTVVAVLQLQERKLLSIDDPVVKHLPVFRVRGKHATTDAITIKQLLSHSSGLGDIGLPILGWIHFDGDVPQNQTLLLEKNMGKYSQLKAGPGKQGRYSNFGYLVLAALIERVSGLSYENFIVKNIIAPLGMDNTDFIYTAHLRTNAAIGSHPVDAISKIVPFYLDMGRAVKEQREGRLWFNEVYSDQKGSSGLIGSVTDLLKFMRVFLPISQSSENPILSNDSIALMQTPVVPVDKSPATAKDLAFGLGWFIGPPNGEFTLNHGGSGMAFVSMLTLYPDRNLGIVVMANSTYLGRTMGHDLIQLLGSINWQADAVPE